MAVLSLDQAARLTELGKITITRAIKCSWLPARRKEDGSYEIDPGEPEPSARRLNALIPWRAARLAHQRADEELRHRLALAEERLADLKALRKTCAPSETHGRRWRRRAYDRRAHPSRHGGCGCARRGDVEAFWRGSAVRNGVIRSR